MLYYFIKYCKSIIESGIIVLYGIAKNLKYFGILLSVTVITVAADKHSRFRSINERRILADEKDIREYIKKTGSDVWKGEAAGEWAASWYGISSKSYKAMPTEFFKDHQGREQSIKQLTTQSAIEYMDKGKKEFVGRYLASSTADLKINTIAGFLHDRMVDHLDIPDESKKSVKENPLRIKALLSDADIKNKYMNLTCQNITIQYYVEKELGKKAS